MTTASIEVDKARPRIKAALRVLRADAGAQELAVAEAVATAGERSSWDAWEAVLHLEAMVRHLHQSGG